MLTLVFKGLSPANLRDCITLCNISMQRTWSTNASNCEILTWSQGSLVSVMPSYLRQIVCLLPNVDCCLLCRVPGKEDIPPLGHDLTVGRQGLRLLIHVHQVVQHHLQAHLPPDTQLPDCLGLGF